MVTLNETKLSAIGAICNAKTPEGLRDILKAQSIWFDLNYKNVEDDSNGR